MRVVRQAEYYDLPDTHTDSSGVDPKIFAGLLGGPKLSTGTLHVDEGRDEW